jgi:hypothetical protein
VPALANPNLHALRQRSAVLLLSIVSDTCKLHSLLLVAGRRWKDAGKVLLPKLGLLQGVLDGYQLPLAPVPFMYTIAMCGHWHPAAACFSQHWNDQGLGRLRGALETAAKATLRMLVLRALPLATNTALRCRELLALSRLAHAHPKAEGGAEAGAGAGTELAALQALCRSANLVLLKLDEATHEARLAREAMLLFLLFVKEQASLGAAESSTPPEGEAQSKPDLSLAPRYFRMLDPRLFRAPSQGPAAQAEHVTGSHLYAYLQEADLPPALAADRVSRGGFAPLEPSGPGPRDAPASAAVQDIFLRADSFASGPLLGGAGAQGGENETFEGGAAAADGSSRFARASLVQLCADVRDQARSLIVASASAYAS